MTIFNFNEYRAELPTNFFHVSKNFRWGDRGDPLDTYDSFWLRAPTSSKVFKFWWEITRYSGKFVITCSSENHNEQWKKLKEAHRIGLLGFGLRSSTKASEKIHFFVHIGNCLEVDLVVRVALNIFSLLIENKPSFHLELDLTTELACYDADHPLNIHLIEFNKYNFDLPLREFVIRALNCKKETVENYFNN